MPTSGRPFSRAVWIACFGRRGVAVRAAGPDDHAVAEVIDRVGVHDPHRDGRVEGRDRVVEGVEGEPVRLVVGGKVHEHGDRTSHGSPKVLISRWIAISSHSTLTARSTFTSSANRLAKTKSRIGTGLASGDHNRDDGRTDEIRKLAHGYVPIRALCTFEWNVRFVPKADIPVAAYCTSFTPGGTQLPSRTSGFGQ